jgi:hypothetical protein
MKTFKEHVQEGVANRNTPDDKAKSLGLVSFDSKFATFSSLIDGVQNGTLLVHARRMPQNIMDLRFGVDPEFGETLKGTEAAQTAEEHGIEPAELIFMSDDFQWSSGREITVFVLKDENMQKSLGDGRVQLSDGSVVRYELSPMADYEDPALKSEPFGVERNDWYTNKIAEVVAVAPFPIR